MTTPESLEFATVIRQWSDDLVVCTNGALSLDAETRDQFHANDIEIREDPIARLAHDDGALEAIIFENGDRLARHAIFAQLEHHRRSDLAEQLGCSFTETEAIETDGFGRSTVASIYVAGDAGRWIHQVSFAVADGAMAGMMTNADLCMAAFDAASRVEG